MQGKVTKAVLCGLGSGALIVLSLFGSKGIGNSGTALTGSTPSPAAGNVHKLQLADDPPPGGGGVGGVRG